METKVKLNIVAFDKNNQARNNMGVFHSERNHAEEIKLMPTGAGGWMVEGDRMEINGIYYTLGKSVPIILEDENTIEINMTVYYCE